MPLGEEHRRIVANILREHPSAKTKKFYRELGSVIGDDWWPPDLRIIPDAFLIDAETKSVTTFEVEISNSLGDAQYNAYSELWWALDEYEWTLKVVTVDRHGVTTSIIDMMSVALSRMVAEAALYPETSERRITETKRLMEEFVRINPANQAGAGGSNPLTPTNYHSSLGNFVAICVRENVRRNAGRSSDIG